MMKSNNRRHTLAITVTTIALFLFGLFWTKLDSMDSRLRAVEQQVAAISARLGITEQAGSHKPSARPPAAYWDDEKQQAGGIIP